jgi:hypothetical protein
MFPVRGKAALHIVELGLSLFGCSIAVLPDGTATIELASSFSKPEMHCGDFPNPAARKLFARLA